MDYILLNKIQILFVKNNYTRQTRAFRCESHEALPVVETRTSYYRRRELLKKYCFVNERTKIIHSFYLLYYIKTERHYKL